MSSSFTPPDSDDAPSGLRIAHRALEAMLAHFSQELPREGCGFLAGRESRADRFYPIQNRSPERRRFLMDPKHVLRTETSIHRRRQRILAVCHSHPEGECKPSKWDVEGAFYDPDLRLPLWVREVHVIALMAPVENPSVRGFRILEGGRVEDVPIEFESPELGRFSTSS